MSAIVKKYCRFCAEKKPETELMDVSIQSQVKDEVKEKLSFFNVNLSIDLLLNSTLPTTVCFSCYASLDNAHGFLLKLRRSQTVLRHVFHDNFTKTDKDSECIVYAGLPVEVKADTPLNDKPKTEIASENDTENESNQFMDEELSETSSVIDRETDKSGSDDEILTYMGLPIFEQDITLNVMENSSKRDESWTSLEWACQHCDASFEDVNMLREHSKKIHDLCGAFKCADCEDTFTHFEVFVEHLRGHRASLRNYCQYCNLELEPSLLTKHTTGHKNNESICERCGKTFDNKYYLRNHNTKYKPLKRKLDSIQNPAKRRKRCRTKNPYVLPLCTIAKIEDKSWNGYPWMCQICESEFSEILILRAHIREAHGKCSAMKCVDCCDIMESYTGFAYHARRHRPFLKQYCHYCNYKFKENEQDKDHIQQHFANSDKICEGCGEIFADTITYQQHVKTYDPPKPRKLPFREKPVGIDELTCNICHTILKSQNSLRSHKLVHTERKKEFTCDRCGKAFYKIAALRAHKATHKEAQEVCKICNKTFRNDKLLKQHVFRHTEDKPFECDVCQKRFRGKHNLASHLRIHTNEAPFKCPYCDKTFRFKSNIRVHVFQHTGARPYQCSECEMDFTDSANRNKHMRRKHGKVPSSNVKTEDSEAVKEWTEKILAPIKRGKIKKGDE